jgi:ABC-2 type transport system permease protein
MPVPALHATYVKRALLAGARLVRFVVAYVKANFEIALEYRAAFWAQVFGMLLNDAMWLAFWGLFFHRFQTVRGYEFRDVVMVWAVAALAFGLTTGLSGNAWRFATQIAQGGLDFYLVLPKPVLLHLAISAMDVSAWGDVLFGLSQFLLFVQPSPGRLALFMLVCLAAMAVLVAYGIAANSLAFWLGNAEGVARELQNTLLIFSTYPSALFGGVAKLLLFTVVPAGFVTYVPVDLLRSWSWPLAGALAGAAVLAVGLAGAIFSLGLRRYESGNLLAMRE